MALEAERFLGALKKEESCATMITLSGDLGAGKTTFARALARALGITENVASPTFVIEKVYTLAGERWQRLVHIDAYRLKSADELRVLDWETLVNNPENLIVVEWPERVPEAIVAHAHRLSIEIGDEEERVIRYG